MRALSSEMTIKTHGFSRQSACDTFLRYVSRFDSSDPKISLKVEHTLKVAKLCDDIARSKGLAKPEVDLAWLCGLLHDIGRFEQVSRWNTFRDSPRSDHAALGTKVLADVDGARIGNVCNDAEWFAIARAAVGLHSVLRLPSELDDRTRMFCEIVRDADKVDIIRVFANSECQSVLGLSPVEFHNGSISDAAMAGFEERRCLGPRDRAANLDGLLGVVCLTFEIMNPYARSALRGFGYLEDLLRRPFGLTPSFSNADTQTKWYKVANHFGVQL